MQVIVENPNTIVIDVDQGRAGRGIQNITYTEVSGQYFLIVTYTDGTTETLGPLVVTGGAAFLLGGAAGSIPYQSAPNTTVFLPIGTQNQVVVAGTSAPQYTSALTGLTVNNSAIGNTTPSTGAFTNLSASGTFALTGDQVQISEGGTGQTTANAAFNALAPSQATHAGKYLKTDGTNTSWDALDISTADITGTLPVANGGTGVTSSTGTGSVVLSASPTFTGTVNGASLTLSSNFTLSGGTANGVAYLNGSKVLTTGSALTFDGSSLGCGAGGTGATNASLILNGSNATNYGSAIIGRRNGVGSWLIGDTGVALGGGATGFINFLYTNDPFIWYSNSTEQMRLTSTGLGIGTSSPSAKLNVSAGGIVARFGAFGTTTYDDFQIESYAGSTGIGCRGSSDLYFQMNGNTRMYLTSAGNLGIGTSSPGVRLDVVGGSIRTTSWVDITPSPATNNALYRATNTGGTFYAGLDNSVGGITGTGYSGVLWHTGAYPISFGTNNTERGRFSSDGTFRVKGAGTAGSTDAVQFAGSAPASSLILDSSGNLALGSTTTTTLSGYQWFRVNGTTGGAIEVTSNNSRVLQIQADGTSAGAQIQTITGSPLIFGTNATERARITSGGYFKASNNGAYVSSTGSYHELRTTDASNPSVYVSATDASYTGQVIYVNTNRAANAAFKLISLNANAVEQFYVSGAGVVYAQNTTIQSLSDARLKENIRDAAEGLNVINALRPVRYDWKTGYGNDQKNQLGFIAQEVETVFPEAVSEWKSNDTDSVYKTIGPGALIPVLVKAIQELKAELDSVKAELATLKGA